MGEKPNYRLIEQIKEKAGEGKTTSEIARELGTSYDCICHYAYRHGIEVKRKKDSLIAIREMAKDGKPPNFIMRKLRISPGSLRYYNTEYKMGIKGIPYKRRTLEEVEISIQSLKQQLRDVKERGERARLEKKIRRLKELRERRISTRERLKKTMDELVEAGEILSYRKIAQIGGGSYELVRQRIIATGLESYLNERKEIVLQKRMQKKV